MESSKVFLSLNKSTITSLQNDVVLIVPNNNNWNDFGFRIRVEIGIKSDQGEPLWLPAYMAIKDEIDTTSYIRKLVKEKGVISLQDISIPYATLLFETQQYALIKNALGFDNAKRVLETLHDIALLSDQEGKVPDWDDFFENEVFSHAITRASESYFAFRRGAETIKTNKLIAADDAQKSFSVDLHGQGPKLHFSFDFEESNSIRGRIAVIVGKNGLGKTVSLAKLAGALSGMESKGIKFNNKPEVNQVLAFVHNESLPLFKPKTKHQSSARVRAFSFNPKIKPTNSRDGFARLLVDIARSYDNEGSLIVFLNSLYTKQLHNIKMYVPTKSAESADYTDSKGRKYISLIRWVKGAEKTRLTYASSIDHSRNLLFLDKDCKPRKLSIGQFAFLQFTLNALANAGPASVFLIDEPENFLHPNLISEFMRLLNRILKWTQSIAIIATHSPFIVREVQSRQVHVIHADDETGEVVVLHPRMQTLGTNVGAISDDVFGDDLPKHLYDELLSEISSKEMSFEKIIELYASEISTEALMTIRRSQEK